MDTPPRPASLSAVPMFAAPPQRDRLDPPSAPLSDPQTDPQPEAAPKPSPSLFGRLKGQSTAAGASSPGTPTSTDGPVVEPSAPKLKPGGDPTEVGETLAGLLMIVCGFITMAAMRRNRRFRSPTPEQRDAIAMPIGRIMTRHLPMQVFGPDFADATKAAAATHNYAADGRLFTRLGQPELDLPEEQNR